MKRISLIIVIMLSLLLIATFGMPAIAADLQTPANETVMPEFDLSSVAKIIALTAFLTQWLKPVLSKVPAKALAIGIGAILTAIAVFLLHSIGGSLPMIFLQVILGVLGAPAAYEILGGKGRNKSFLSDG